MLQNITTSYRKLRPEDPRRIQAFRASLEGLKWGSQDLLASLSTLFAAVDDLAGLEVKYYYRRRGTRAWISGATRFVAWLLGSIGLLLPYIALTDSSKFKDLVHYGYVCLAIATSALAANSLFGGTNGHIRFVTTQLELEKLITSARVDWCKYLAGPHSNDEDVDKGFTLIRNYAISLHTATITETGRWGETLLAELAKYQKTIEAKGDTKGDSK